MAKDIRIIPASGQINVTGSADFKGTGNTSVLFITGSGGVGINTTDPSDDLHVAGTFRATAVTGNRIGNGTDITKALSILDTGMTAGDTNVVTLGRNAANNNQAELTFYLAQTGSTANRLSLGLYNSNNTLNVLGSGYVGIGTTSPSWTLTVDSGATNQIARFTSNDSNSVISVADSDDIAFFGTSGNMAYFGLTNGLHTSNVNVDSVGRVGIGVTTPLAMLHINNFSYPQLLLDGGGDTNGDIVVPSGEILQVGHWNTSTNSYTGRFRIETTGQITLDTYGSGTFTGTAAYNLAVDSSGRIIETPGASVDGLGSSNYFSRWVDSNTLTSSSMYQDGTNVGIGVTSTTSTLHVSGTNNVLLVEGSGSTLVDVQGSQGQLFSVTDSLEGSLFSVNDISGLPILEVFDTDKMVAGTYGQNTLVVTGSVVGIGTGTPSEKLHVAGDVAIDAQGSGNTASLKFINDNERSRISSNYDTGGGGRLTFHTDTTGGTLVERVRINNAGSVGIGTTSPQRELHIIGDSWAELRLEGKTFNSGHGGAVEFYSEGTHLADINALTTKDLVFRTNGGSEKMRITAAGNVGIGTTSPGKLLTVNGESQFIGESFFNAGFDVTAGTGTRFRDDLPLNFGTSRIFELVYDSTTDKLEFNSGSDAIMSLDGDGNLELQGDLTVEGTITAKEFHTTFVSASIIYQSGSTKFGNSTDDNHAFTGSINLLAQSGATGLRIERGSTLWMSMNSDSSRQIFQYSSNLDFRNVNSTSVMYLSGSGNVGIGTNAPAAKLEIYDGTSPEIKINRLGNSVNGALWFNRDNQKKAGIITTSEGAYSRKGLAFYTNDVGDYTTDATEKVRIDDSGNVGIGTTVPKSILEISNASPEFGFHDTGAGDRGSIQFQDGKFEIYTNTTVDGKPSVNGTQVVTIEKGGNVGIGVTNPAFQLDVYEPETNVVAKFKSGDNQAWISVQDDASGTYGAMLGTDTDAGHHVILADNSANKRLVINGDGNVGIGVDSPSKKLHINGSTANFVALFESSDTKGGINLADNTTSLDGVSLYAVGDNFGIRTGQTDDRLYITGSTGYVGIGTTDPTRALTVNSGTTNIVASFTSTDSNVGISLVDSATSADSAVQVRAAGDDLNLVAGSNERLRLKSDGQLRLYQYGSGNFTANSVYRLAVDADGNVIEESLGDGAINGLGASRYMARWVDTDSLTTSSMYEKENGFIGINTTNPITELDIRGGLNVDGGHIYFNTNGYTVKFDHDGTRDLYQVGYNGTPKMYLRAVDTDDLQWEDVNTDPILKLTQEKNAYFYGSVGIGTTSPKGPLDVFTTSGNANAYIRSTTGNAYLQIDSNLDGAGREESGIIFSDSGSAHWAIYKDSGDDFSIYDYTGGYKALEIFDNGRMDLMGGAAKDITMVFGGGSVGIGTISPTRKLTVGSLASTVGNAIAIVSTGSSGAYSQLMFGDETDDNKGQIIYVPSSGKLQLQTGGGGVISARGLTLDSSENVGIGTDAPNYKFEVDGGSNIGVAKFNNSSATSTILYYGDTGNTQYTETQYLTNDGIASIFKNGTGYSSYGGIRAFNIYNEKGGISLHPDNATSPVLFATGSSVGIGTTEPATKLQVLGQVRADNFYATATTYGLFTKSIYFDNTESTGYYTTVNGLLAFDENFYQDSGYGSGTYDPAQAFTTNGGGLVIKNEDGWGALVSSQNMRWLNADFATLRSQGISKLEGNTTVGSDATADGRLDVRGNYGRWRVNGYGSMYFRNDSVGEYENYIHARSDGALSIGLVSGSDLTGTAPDSYATTNHDYVYIASDGNVGIGTTSPNNPLHVESPEIFIAKFKTTANVNQVVSLEAPAGKNTNLYFYEGSTTEAGIRWDGTDDKFIFKVDNLTNDALTILDNGNVGIGDSTPSYKLDVAGTGYFGGLLYTNDIEVDGGNTILVNNSSAGHITIGGMKNEQENGYLRGNITFTRDAGQLYYDAGDNVFTHAGGGSTDWTLLGHHSDGFRIYAGPSSTGFTASYADFRSDYMAMYINSNGAIQLGQYGSGNRNGTAAYTLAVDSSGNIIEESVGAGLVNGTGDTRYLTRWEDASTITSSSVYEATSGNIGIGTSSPLGTLEISTSNVRSSANAGADDLVIQNNSYAGISIFASKTAASQILFGDDDSEVRGKLQYFHTDDSMRFATSAQDTSLYIASNGNIGVGLSSPVAKLHISGSGGTLAKIESSNGEADILYGSGISGGTEWQVGTGYASAPGGAGSFYLYQGGATKFAVKTSGATYTQGDATIGGDLTVDGIITAKEFHTTFVSASIIYQSGSTQFGNSNDDTHDFQGSLTVSKTVNQSVIIENTDDAGNNDDLIIKNTNDRDVGIKFETGGGSNYIWQDSFGDDSLHFSDSDLNTTLELYQDQRAQFNGNVGIGRTPSYKLDVEHNDTWLARFIRTGGTPHLRFENSTQDGDFAVFYAANNLFKLARRSGSNDEQDIWLAGNSDGNVGIGTDTPSGRFNSYISATRQITHNGNGGDFSVISDNNSAPVAYIKGTGTADLLNVFDNTTEVFTIVDGGRVGIGLGGPRTNLHIKDDTASAIGLSTTSTTAPAGAFIELQNSSGTTNSGVGITAVGLGTKGRYGAITFVDDTSDNNGTGGHIEFHTSPSKTGTLDEQMRLTKDGYLGIGYTAPSAKLHVSGAFDAAFAAAFENDSDSGHGLIIRAGGTSGTRYITQWKDAAGTERFHMDDTGEAYFQNNVRTDGVLSTYKYLFIDRTDDARGILFEDNGGTNTIYFTVNDGQGNFNMMGGVNHDGNLIDSSDGATKILYSFHGQDGTLSLNAGNIGTAGDAAVYNVGISVHAPTQTLRIGNPNDNVGLTSTGGVEIADVAGNLYTSEYIYHTGDTDTSIRMTVDAIQMFAGNIEMMRLIEDGTQDIIVINENSNDVDFRVEGNANTHLLFVDAGVDRVGIDTSDPQARFHVNNDIAWSAQDLGSSSSGSVAFKVNGRSGATHDFIVSSNGTTDYTMQVVQNASSAGDININPFGGGVGIGRNHSAFTLDVGGSTRISSTTGNTELVLTHQANNTSAKIVFMEDESANYKWAFGYDDSQSNKLFFNAYENVVGTNGSNTVMTLDPNTFHVGIGTDAPTARLNVKTNETGYAGDLATSVTSGSVHFRTHATDSTITTFGAIDGGDGYIQRSNGAGTTSYALTLNPWGGDVGIGTDAPSETLHVNGTFYAAGASHIDDTLRVDGDLTIKGGNTQHSIIKFERSDVSSYPFAKIGFSNPAAANSSFLISSAGNGNPLVIEAGTGDPISFQNSGSSGVVEYGRFDGNGNLGIDVTNPSARLHVYSPTTNVTAYFESGDAEAWISLKDSNSGTYGVLLGHDPNANELFKIADDNAYERLIMTTGGNVSIGDSFQPDARLHVSGTNDVFLVEGSGSTLVDVQGSQGQLFSITDTLVGSLFSVNDISGLPILEVFDTDKVVAGTYGQNTLVVTGSLVGIGTGAPQSKLNVNVEDGESTLTISRGGSTPSTSTAIGRVKFTADYSNIPTEFGHIYTHTNDVGSARGSMDFAVKSTSGNVLTGMTLYGTNAGVNVGIGTTSPSSALSIVGKNKNILVDKGNVSFTAGTLAEIDDHYAFAYYTLRNGSTTGLFITNVDTNIPTISVKDSSDNAQNLSLQTYGGSVYIGGKSRLNGYSSDFTTLSVHTQAGDYASILELAGNRNANPGNQNGMIQFWNKGGANTEVGRIQSIQGSTTGSGEFTFSTKPEGGSLAEAMRIDEDGNVGIGTNSPGTKLDVNGITRISGDFAGTGQDPLLQFYNTDASLGTNQILGTIDFHQSDPSGGGVGVVSRIRAINDSSFKGEASLTFHTGEVGVSFDERMRISSVGNVGIGTTSPTADLHIADTNSDVLVKIHAITGANDPILEFQGNSNDITVEGFQLWYDNSVGDMHLATTYANDDAAIRFHTRTGASKSTINERLTIAGNGNVGVGTATPGAKLHVNGNMFVEEGFRFGTTSNANLAGDGYTGNLGLIQMPTFLLDQDLGTGDGRAYGVLQPGVFKPSSKTLADSGYSGVAQGSAVTGLFPNVKGEADVPIIDGNATWTYAEAVEALETVGARLPTLQELMASVGAGSGQSYDDKYLWTQTPAGHGKVWVCRGDGVDLPDAIPVSVTGSYRTRAFWDIDKANLPVHYDDNSDIRTKVVRAEHTDGLKLYDTADNGIFIEHGGNIGVGTTTPSEIMHIQADRADILLESTTANQATRYRLKTTGREWRIGTNTPKSDSFWIYDADATAYRLEISTSGQLKLPAYGAGVLISDASGNISVGAATSATNADNVETVRDETGTGAHYLTFVDNNNVTAAYEQLYTNSGLYTTPNNSALYSNGEVVAYASSDSRLKDNKLIITGALNKISKIGGYEFDWNDKQDVYQGHDVGVIAQEVEEILPEVVTTREDGYKAVKYEKIVPLLIEGIKEQKDIVEKQQKEIDELKSELKAIRDMLLQKP